MKTLQRIFQKFEPKKYPHYVWRNLTKFEQPEIWNVYE